jgi:hypothetical protein
VGAPADVAAILAALDATPDPGPSPLDNADASVAYEDGVASLPLSAGTQVWGRGLVNDIQRTHSLTHSLCVCQGGRFGLRMGMRRGWRWLGATVDCDSCV